MIEVSTPEKAKTNNHKPEINLIADDKNVSEAELDQEKQRGQKNRTSNGLSD